MSKTALITGATAGIGCATAEIFAENSWNVIITGRRKERLDELSEELKGKYGVEVLALEFDVRDREVVEEKLGNLPGDWQEIDVLVNNAGLARHKAPIYDGDPEDWDTMVDTNIKGLLYVTKAVTPFLQKTKGHIINLGSIAGKEAYKGGAVYNATKFAVDALTKAMRIDYLDYGIRVTSICPGNVETEFSLVRFDGDSDKAKSVYEGYDALTARDIAEAIWFAVSRPAHVTINDMLIMPTAQANTVHLKKD